VRTFEHTRLQRKRIEAYQVNFCHCRVVFHGFQEMLTTFISYGEVALLSEVQASCTAALKRLYNDNESAYQTNFCNCAVGLLFQRSGDALSRNIRQIVEKLPQSR